MKLVRLVHNIFFSECIAIALSKGVSLAYSQCGVDSRRVVNRLEIMSFSINLFLAWYGAHVKLWIHVAE